MLQYLGGSEAVAGIAGALVGIPTGAAVVVSTLWTRMGRVEKDVYELGQTRTKDRADHDQLCGRVERLLGRLDTFLAREGV